MEKNEHFVHISTCRVQFRTGLILVSFYKGDVAVLCSLRGSHVQMQYYIGNGGI